MSVSSARSRAPGRWLALAALAVTLAGGSAAPGFGAPPAVGQRIVIDDFEDVSAWSAQPASGVELAIRSDAGAHGKAMRLDFGFSGGGYAIARRAVAIDLPENYRLRFAVRGACLPNDLELKLIDQSGENVWWHNRRGFTFPTAWDSLSSRKRQITFAWGPAGGGDITRLAAIEIVVTAGQGGRGSVWIDDFTLEALPPPAAQPPAPTARASSGDAALAIDGRADTYWAPATGDVKPWLAVDLGADREFGGIQIDWAPERHGSSYVIETSADGRSWQLLREVLRADGGKDFLRLPDAEARHVRWRTLEGRGRRAIGMNELIVRPLEWGATPESFFKGVAGEYPRGRYPRAIRGEPSSWTLVGRSGDKDEALFGQDGLLETGKAQFSIEPFLAVGQSIATWADVETRRWLEEGRLPLPHVEWSWRGGDLTLQISPVAAGQRDRPELWARYRVTNVGARRTRGTLYLALRPFQVNPPVQFLNTPGGTAPIRRVSSHSSGVAVNDRMVASLNRPSGFGATVFERGDISEFLFRGSLPKDRDASDPEGLASAVLAYAFDLAPEQSRDVILVVPFRADSFPRRDSFPPRDSLPPGGPFPRGNPPPGGGSLPGGNPFPALDIKSDAHASEQFDWRFKRARDDARAALAPVSIRLPEAARDLELTLAAQLGWIAINRDGPAIQPGSRAYERSWIRDGSLTSSALLKLGHPRPVKAFMEWFAGYQYPDGKVPCCVDHRGADPVPEHDSHGELIFLIAEYHRYTGDHAAVERLWPRVLKATAYLDSLRRERRGAEWQTPERRHFYGLLPPSISHEGYSAKPMHSYWDDFFALRGYKDAVYLAGVLDHAEDRDRLSASRDEFAGDLAASIRAAMAHHRIDFVPGCADLGDFDATSTTIALAPVAAEGVIPDSALERTFERYWEFFRDRRDGKKPWEAFTPYEIRNVGAFVRLGWRERAHELLQFFMEHRDPPEWKQWAEVAWNDTTTPHFIGDLPHTWVGSDYVRSVLDMLAYEREADSSLVVGAGIPWSWLADSAGVEVRGLSTPYGKLGFTMRSGDGGVVVRLEPGLRVPPGGIRVIPPPPAPSNAYASVRIDGQDAGRPDSAIVRRLPATLVFTR